MWTRPPERPALAPRWRKELLLVAQLILASCTLCWEFTWCYLMWRDWAQAEPASCHPGSEAARTASRTGTFQQCLCLQLEMDRCSIAAYKRYSCPFSPSSLFRQKKEERQCKSKCVLCKFVPEMIHVPILDLTHLVKPLSPALQA